MLREHVPYWLAVGLLTLAYGLALTSAIQKSPTIDEQNHIAQGAVYLGTGDPRLNVEHPPVVNLLSALPAHLLLDLELPLDQWWEAGEWNHFGDNFLWHVNQNPGCIVFLSRLPIIGLGLLLGSLVFRWARACFGPWGGLLAAAFCALDPNVLAHERLSTTDAGGTFFAFLAAYALWQAIRRPRTSGRLPSVFLVLWAGVALGLAFAAKLSMLLFGPILALTALLEGVSGGTERASRLARRVIILLAIAVVAILVVWASYRFQVGSLDGIGFPVPAPPYIQGIRAVLGFASGGRPAYLLGEISTSGWWYYFPVAFAVKTPLATLVALGAAAVLMLRRPSRDDVFILVPPLTYFLILLTARFNLGYRHLLPMLPFLAVHVGRLAPPASRSLHPASCILQTCQLANLQLALPIILVIALAFSTLFIYPHFLAYFNPIAGGPKNGWRVLADSNIDWGQGLIGLRRWMKRENVERVRLSWFGSAYPERYGITYDPLPGIGFPSHFELWFDPPFDPKTPEPGVYVISVNNLVGIASPKPDLYAWFRARPPDARIGYSLFVYEVED